MVSAPRMDVAAQRREAMAVIGDRSARAQIAERIDEIVAGENDVGRGIDIQPTGRDRIAGPGLLVDRPDIRGQVHRAVLRGDRLDLQVTGVAQGDRAAVAGPDIVQADRIGAVEADVAARRRRQRRRGNGGGWSG